MSRKRLDKDDLSLWKKVTERTEKLDVDKLFRAEIDGTSAANPQAQLCRDGQARSQAAAKHP